VKNKDNLKSSILIPKKVTSKRQSQNDTDDDTTNDNIFKTKLIKFEFSDDSKDYFEAINATNLAGHQKINENSLIQLNLNYMNQKSELNEIKEAINKSSLLISSSIDNLSKAIISKNLKENDDWFNNVDLKDINEFNICMEPANFYLNEKSSDSNIESIKTNLFPDNHTTLKHFSSLISNNDSNQSKLNDDYSVTPKISNDLSINNYDQNCFKSNPTISNSEFNSLSDSQILLIKEKSASGYIFGALLVEIMFDLNELKNSSVKGGTRNGITKKALDPIRINYIQDLCEKNFNSSKASDFWYKCMCRINRRIKEITEK